MTDTNSGLKPVHTREHWTIEVYGDGDSLVIHRSEDERVCFMATPGTKGAFKRIKERAHLIAAAPEMLEALHQCIGSLKALGAEKGHAAEAARAAILKATGGAL